MNNKLGTVRLAIAALFVAAAATLQATDTWKGTVNTNWSNVTNWSTTNIPSSGEDVIIADQTTTSSFVLDDGSHTIGQLMLGTNGTRSTTFRYNDFTSAPYANNVLTINTGIFATATSGGVFIAQGPITFGNNAFCRVNGTPGNAQTGTTKGVILSGFSDSPYLASVVTDTLNGPLTKVGGGNLLIRQPLTVQGNGNNIIVQEGSLTLYAIASSSSQLPLTIAGPGNIIVSNGASLNLVGGFDTSSFNVTRQIIVSNNATVGFGLGFGGHASCQAPINWNGNSGGSANLTHSGGGLTYLAFNNAPWSGSATVTLGTSTAQPFNVQFVNSDNSAFSGKLINNAYGGSTMCPVQFMTNTSGSANAEWSLANNQAKFELINEITSLQFGALSGPNGILLNDNSSTAATVTVGALGTSTSFGANIIDGTSPLAVVKIGGGTWTLSGNNSFTGGLIVSNGTVNAQPADSNTPGIGNGFVSIMTNATLLAYGNSTPCNVTNYAGGTVGCPGNGTWSLGSLTLGRTSSDVTSNQFEVDLGAMIIVTNNNNSLAVNGTNIVNIFGAAPAVGVYDLIEYTGTVQGNPGPTGFNGFKLGSLPVGCIANLQIFTGPSYSALQLNVTASTVHPLQWVGYVSTNWDTYGVMSWKDVFNGTMKAFTNNFDTVFNDGASNFVVNVSNVQPASVTISNSAHTYTFGGSGTISGLGYLLKDGSGTAILVNSNNTYIGGTFVTNGVLQVGNGGTNGMIPGDPQGVDVGPNGTLVFSHSDTISYSGQITGSGTVEQLGPGTLTLTGDNSQWTGNLLVAGGTYKPGVGGISSFGDPGSPVIITNGATLDMFDSSLGPKEVIIGGNGALINSESGSINKTMVRYITMNGPATVGGDGSWWVITTNTAQGTFNPGNGGIDTHLLGNGNPLTKTGSGLVSFLNVGDTGLGDIIITKGSLSFSYYCTLGDPASNLRLYPGAQITLSGTLPGPSGNPNLLSKNVFMTNAALQVINGECRFYGSITLVSNNDFNVSQNSSFNPLPSPLKLYASVTGPGLLGKTGAESLIIPASASALHTGGTTVSAGFLQVDGTLGAGAAIIAVTNAGTLCGIGVIKDGVTVQSGGIIAPGDPGGGAYLGTLTVSNSVTLLPGGIAQISVDKSVPGNALLNVSGSLTYSGTLSLSNITAVSYAVGDSFKMFNAGSYLGSFQNIAPSVPGPGLVWNTNSLTVDGTLSVVEAPPTLTNLVISPAGTLNPPFTTNNPTYTATNAYVSNPVTVTAYAADPGSTLQLSLNGGAFGPLTSGVASPAQTLVLPTNTVAVKVTSADNLANQTYTVNVTLKPSLTPATLAKSVNGSTLTLTWPADHLGWLLQVQTNTTASGITTNWVTIPGTDWMTQTNFTVIKTSPSVFYRLRYSNQ
jgi:autotransporter-associated beta strand protein